MYVIGVDVVTRAIFATAEFDSRMLIRPDVVVSVLRAFLDTGNLDVVWDVLWPTRCTIDNLTRKCLLHALLLLLLDV